MTDHRIDLTLYALDRIMEGEITDGKTMAAIFMTARLFLI